MDLKVGRAEPTDAERAAVDAVLGAPSDGWDGGERSEADRHVARRAERASSRRRHLLATLHAVNDCAGWISPGALAYISRRLDIAPADLYGVASFYGLFSLDARPTRQVHVCVDLACSIAAGAVGPGGVGAVERVPVPAGAHASPCLGLCERAPAALVIEAGDSPRQAVLAPTSAMTLDQAVRGSWPGDETPVAAAVPQPASDRTLLRRVGAVNPVSLGDYRAHGGYEALAHAVELGPAGVVDEVLASGLVGRGGAAFPAGRKWEAVARHPTRPHHLVCNADESEPGTFKDRVIMEGDPFALVEAMTIAGFAVGAERGIIYLRGEYPRARATLSAAIESARGNGLLGADVAGHGFAFDIDIVRGAGAYICGEETAIFNSIEGFRGEPRAKPPFPVDAGLFHQPTVVNNVETLVNVLPIVLGGGAAYAATGTEGSSGTKLLCLSGRVARPGVYEVTFGATLGEVIDMAGGIIDGRPLQAVLLGGAAGTFVGPEQVDLPLTFEGTRAAGASLGSGVVMVLDDTVVLEPFVRRIASFFRHESCGQCVPCRVGTVRQEEVLSRLSADTADGVADRSLLADVGRVMRDASICGLGQTAYNAVESAISIGAFRRA